MENHWKPHMWIKETFQCFICESAFISLYKVPGKCTETAIRGNLISVHIIWNWADKQFSCSLLGIIRIWLCAHTVILPVSQVLFFTLIQLPPQLKFIAGNNFFGQYKMYWSLSVWTVNAIIRSYCKTSSYWFEQRKCKNCKNSKNML